MFCFVRITNQEFWSSLFLVISFLQRRSKDDADINTLNILASFLSIFQDFHVQPACLIDEALSKFSFKHPR